MVVAHDGYRNRRGIAGGDLGPQYLSSLADGRVAGHVQRLERIGVIRAARQRQLAQVVRPFENLPRSSGIIVIGVS
jgi:hypothetical protein